MATLEQFIEKYHVKMSHKSSDNNPYWDSQIQANHYKVILRCQRRQYTTVYSMGIGIGHAPELNEVLDCLASDAAGVNGRSFEEWANDYGFDPDSIKAHEIYRACRRTSKNLSRLLGNKAYQDLLWDTERM